MTTHSSFGDLSAADFETHATSIMNAHATSVERKQALAYLSSTLQKDRSAIEVEQKALSKRRVLYRRQRIAYETHLDNARYDYSKTSAVFTETTKTDSEIAALLTGDNAEVNIGARTLTTDVLFSGDNVTLTGTGASGSAVDGTLACTCKIIGQLQLAGTNVIIEGIHFHHTTDSGGDYNRHIMHTAACSNFTFENCLFTSDAGAYATRQWFWGIGSHYTGNLTIRNCQIGAGADGYGCWGIVDINTDSSHNVTSDPLKKVVIDKCLIKNCAGSIAIRGNPDSPNESCTITNNVFSLDSGYALHALFWAVYEVNNCSKVIITDNTSTCVRLPSDDNSFVQLWSKSKFPWTVRFRRNTIAGFNIGISVPCAATFYAPAHNHNDFSIASATLTDVDYSSSWLWDGSTALLGTYAPENIDPFDHIPSTLGGAVLGPIS